VAPVRAESDRFDKVFVRHADDFFPTCRSQTLAVLQRREGTQNLLCAYLAGAVLVGLLGNAFDVVCAFEKSEPFACEPLGLVVVPSLCKVIR
jgi:hypothetical protein